MKAIISFSVDPALLEELQKRVPKNQRSAWLEKRIQEYIDHNRYELEKTKAELKEVEATGRMLLSQIEEMEKARDQLVLKKSQFYDEFETIILPNIRHRGGNIQAFFKTKAAEDLALRYQMSQDEFRTHVLDKMKEVN